MSDFHDVWERLKEVEPSSSSLMVRLRMPVGGRVPIYGTLDSQTGLPGIQIDLKGHFGKAALAFPRIRGLTVSLASSDRNGGADKSLFVTMTDAGTEALFIDIAEDLCRIASSASDEHEAVRLIVSRVHEWRDFMSNFADGAPSQQEATGLFGELAFLRDVLAETVSVNEAYEAWAGPRENAKDFIRGGVAVEVKTTLAEAADRFTISSLDQLDDAGLEKLFLLYQKLAPSPEGESLSELVGSVRSMLAAYPDLLSAFEGTLIRLGWSASHLNHDRARTAYRLDSRRYYAVGEGFPRYTRKDLVEGTIINDYQILLRSCQPHQVEAKQVIHRLKKAVK